MTTRTSTRPNTLPDSIPFTHPSAPNFRATIKPESLPRLQAYFAKSDKQMVRAATCDVGQFRRTTMLQPRLAYTQDPVAAMRMGVADYHNRRPAYWPSGDEPVRATLLSRLQLVDALRTCPANHVPFYSYFWAWASARDGLDVVPDDETQPATELAEAA